MNSFIKIPLVILGVFGIAEAFSDNVCHLNVSSLKQILVPDGAAITIKCEQETYQGDVSSVTCVNGKFSCDLVCPANDHILIIGGLTADKQSYHNDAIEFFPESPCMSRILSYPLNTPRSHATAGPIDTSSTWSVYLAGGRPAPSGSTIDPGTEVFNVSATNLGWHTLANPNLQGNQDAVWVSHMGRHIRGCGTFGSVLKCIKLQLESDDVEDVPVTSGAGLPTTPSCASITYEQIIWMFGSKNDSTYRNKITIYNNGRYKTQQLTLENLNDCGAAYSGVWAYVCGNQNNTNAAAGNNTTLCNKCTELGGNFRCEPLPNLNRKRTFPSLVMSNLGIYALFGGDDSIEFLDYLNETKWQLAEDFPKFGNRWHAAVSRVFGHPSFYGY